MRVIGEIENTPFKITVFSHNQRFTVKFESGTYELGFRIREDEQYKNFEDVKKFVNPQLVENVKSHFQDMHRSALMAFSSVNQASEEDEFETII
jgi:hypothetical protein